MTHSAKDLAAEDLAAEDLAAEDLAAEDLGAEALASISRIACSTFTSTFGTAYGCGRCRGFCAKRAPTCNSVTSNRSARSKRKSDAGSGPAGGFFPSGPISAATSAWAGKG